MTKCQCTVYNVFEAHRLKCRLRRFVCVSVLPLTFSVIFFPACCDILKSPKNKLRKSTVALILSDHGKM